MTVPIDLALPPISFDDNLKTVLSKIANTIRVLSLDAVEKAGSGHAGTPMGCAEIGAYLYGFHLNHNPINPKWVNRDRFILSAGHASMLQYSCLHLSGYNLSIDDLKNFRQLNSKTPSHPQYGTTEGVESSTGVDGQGIAHGIGQALGLKILGNRFNRKHFLLYDAKVIVLAGDGCFMEGVSHESSSLAGHLNLDNLILIYDRNKTSLDGLVSESCSEDTKKRYEAYGWDVYKINGHNFDEIHQVFSFLRQFQKKPTLIIADTVMGKGSFSMEGSYFAHSNPFKQEERSKTKLRLGFPLEDFFVPSEIYEFFRSKLNRSQLIEKNWEEIFLGWSRIHPDLYAEFQQISQQRLPEDLETQLRTLVVASPVSGRAASHEVINFLGDLIPSLYGGSADLARSDMTHMDHYGIISPPHFDGRNIKYGVREFGMGAMAIGLAQTNMLTPFIGTFLAFSDYMLNSIRMAALMRLRIIYQLTHDSIFIGQDGPTHQPIEHLSYLRAIPNLQVLRPADANEVKMAWIAALRYAGPTAIILSRQELSSCIGTDRPYEEGVGRGAYVIKDDARSLDFTLISTGSEVFLTLAVAEDLELKGYSVRVVSMPSWTLFETQSKEYKESILKKDSGERISIEASSELGWHKYVQSGRTISMQTFGKSALPNDLAKEFGFTVDQIVETILIKNQGS